LLTQSDEILQPCLSCQLYLHVTYHVSMFCRLHALQPTHVHVACHSKEAAVSGVE